MSERIRMQEPIEPPPQPPVPPTPQQPPPASEPKPHPPGMPPPTPKEAPPPAAAEAAAEGEQQAEKPEATPAPEPDARKLQDAIARLTREKWEARRDAEAAAARLAELQRPQPQPGQPADPVDVAKAQLRSEQQHAAFNAACNKTFAAGKAAFADFADAVDALNAVGAGSRPDFLSAVTAMPEGHRIYHALAQDLDNAARVLSLPPMAMAVEIARLSLAGAEPAAAAAPPRAAVSNAPPPIRPIGGSSRGAPSLERMSMAEFIKQRDKEEAERRGR